MSQKGKRKKEKENTLLLFINLSSVFRMSQTLYWWKQYCRLYSLEQTDYYVAEKFWIVVLAVAYTRKLVWPADFLVFSLKNGPSVMCPAMWQCLWGMLGITWTMKLCIYGLTFSCWLCDLEHRFNFFEPSFLICKTMITTVSMW